MSVSQPVPWYRAVAVMVVFLIALGIFDHRAAQRSRVGGVRLAAIEQAARNVERAQQEDSPVLRRLRCLFNAATDPATASVPNRIVLLVGCPDGVRDASPKSIASRIHIFQQGAK